MTIHNTADELKGEVVISQMTAEVLEFVKEKGWDDDRTFGDEIALIHSECSEALEAYRSYGLSDVTVQSDENSVAKPEGVGSELADILIRILDTCARHDINLYKEYARKMKYNRTRAFRHGNKAL